MTDDGEPATPAGPGWYPDPWHASSRRYWTGTEWTSLAFPDRTAGDAAGAAARAGEPDPFAVRPPPPPASPPPPGWVRPDRPVAPPDDGPSPVAGPEPRTGARAWPVLLSVGAVLLAVALILGFVVARGPGRTAAAPAPSVPTTAPPGTTPSPGATTSPGRAEVDLARLGLRQSDVEQGVLVLPIDGGLQVSGEVTLDLCNASYPSESLRRDRVQVAGYDLSGSATLSTEAVRYADSGAVAQAWAEIQQAAARCASTQPGAVIDARIDNGWPDVKGVQRLAYDLTTPGADGQPQHSVVVYLSRGNVLLGVYFPSPDGPQTSVEGHTTIPGIVDVFAKRLAALPPSGLAASGPAGVGPTA